jgi:hypothetical protein
MRFEMKRFVNISLFNGWVDYIDDLEQRWRREEDSGAYKFFKEKDNSFIFEGALRTSKRILGIEKVHKEFLKRSFDGIE